MNVFLVPSVPDDTFHHWFFKTFFPGKSGASNINILVFDDGYSKYCTAVGGHKPSPIGPLSNIQPFQLGPNEKWELTSGAHRQIQIWFPWLLIYSTIDIFSIGRLEIVQPWNILIAVLPGHILDTVNGRSICLKYGLLKSLPHFPQPIPQHPGGRNIEKSFILPRTIFRTFRHFDIKEKRRSWALLQGDGFCSK